MRLLFLFFAIAYFSIAAFSQHEKPTKYLSFTAGPSIAVGNFGKKEITNPFIGFAGTGQFASISYGVLLDKKFGVCIELQGHRHPLATGKLETAYANTDLGQAVIVWPGPPAPPPTPPPPAYYPNWNFKKSSWLSASVQAGGYGFFPLRSKLSLHAKALIGPAYAKCPKIEGSSITDTTTAHIIQNDGSAWAFAFTLGTGLQYDISSTLFISAQLSFFGTNNFRFRQMKTTTITTKRNPGSPDYQVSQSTRIFDRSQHITSLLPGIGVGLRI
jgi:opacity protein-like surface antigen